MYSHLLPASVKSDLLMPRWRGKNMAPTGHDAAKEKEKDKGQHLPTIEVEYVYGYRGRDCHANLHWSREGLAVFHASTIGIGMDVSTGKQMLFSGHSRGKGMVTCITLHPDGVTVATGEAGGPGDGGGVFVWTFAEQSGNLSQASGVLKRGVQCIAFANGGAWVAAAGGDWPVQEIVLIDWNVKPAQVTGP